MNKNPVFFYGLFMDPDLLRQSGFQPSEPVVAELRDYKLIIGQRATLVEKEGISAWGTIMSLSDNELEELYSAPSVADYEPVAVRCNLQNGATVPADVYILPEGYVLVKPENSKYIDQLTEIGNKVGLPGDYISTLTKMADEINIF